MKKGQRIAKVKYSGWPTYETWCAMAWLDSDESLTSYWEERARQCLVEARHKRKPASFLLAEELKEQFLRHNPLAGEAGLWADLLDCAISHIGFYAMARAFLEGVNDEENP